MLSFNYFSFGPKGIPVTALSAVLHELEDYANQYFDPRVFALAFSSNRMSYSFLSILLRGRINCKLSMEGDDLQIDFFEFDQGHTSL